MNMIYGYYSEMISEPGYFSYAGSVNYLSGTARVDGQIADNKLLLKPYRGRHSIFETFVFFTMNKKIGNKPLRSFMR